MSLLAKMRCGDEKSWKRFVYLYGPLMYSWCRRAGLSEDDSRDVSQDVFATLATKLALFRKDRPGDSFRRWLRTVVNNRARDLQRQQKDAPKAIGGTDAQINLSARSTGTSDTPQETEDEIANESNHLLRRATELVRTDFRPKTWQAFWQTAVDGRADFDVAADLGMSKSAVRTARSRVRSRLRAEMADLME